MKILITGAGGNLGRAITPALLKKGHKLRLMDFRPIETSCDFYLGDVRNSDDCIKAAKGMNAIIHGAALLGSHAWQHTTDEFWDTNITGTHNMFLAAIKHDIKKIVFSSTADVYGKGINVPEDEYREVKESDKNLPEHIYGFSKLIGEQMCAYYSRIYNIQIIALRLGIFLPDTFINYGFRLLKGGIDDRDVAQAFELAIENDSLKYDFFNIMSQVPFTNKDKKNLVTDPISVLSQYYPNLKIICEKEKISLNIFQTMCPWWGNNYWSIDKAKKILGYNPKYNFKEFLHALSKNDFNYYPYANLPTWRGIPSLKSNIKDKLRNKFMKYFQFAQRS